MNGFRFTKPSNKRYVDMCIEFDREFYGPCRDDEKLFSYMFLLFKMFAHKGNYFKNPEDYDQYAMFAATTIYMRYLRKWEKGERIKSVLNYIKTVKGPMKVTYQNENFGQVFDPERDNKTDADGMREWHRANVERQFDPEMKAEVEGALDSIPPLLAKAASESQFSRDPKAAKDLLISALLTFADRVTLPEGREFPGGEAQALKAYEAESRKPVSLWKLPKGMEAEVEVIINKARAWASEGINEIRGRYTLPDDVIDDIMSSAYKDACMASGEEED